MRNESRSDALPTPEQIRTMTAEIRKQWSPREFRKRAGLARAMVNIPFWTEPSPRVSRWTHHTA